MKLNLLTETTNHGGVRLRQQAQATVVESELHKENWGYEFSGTVAEMLEFLRTQPKDAPGIVSVHIKPPAVKQSDTKQSEAMRPGVLARPGPRYGAAKGD